MCDPGNPGNVAFCLSVSLPGQVTVISDTGFSALLPFSFFLQDFFYALIPLVKLLPFLPSKQEKTDASEGHTVRI